MKRSHAFFFAVLAGAALLGSRIVSVSAGTRFETGTPQLQSMSALAFGPNGVLFIGDGKAGRIVAIDLQDAPAAAESEALSIDNIEAKIGALLGTSAAEVMIHDMAVNPISQSAYLAVSRGRGAWDTRWELPNDLADATLLLRVRRGGTLEDVSLRNVRFASVDLPNPIDPAKEHRWKKGVSLRADTITDMAYANGTLYVAGLSNEDFASTMWRVPYPFAEDVAATTLEIFHGAHGAYETHAPVRAFVPYALRGRDHLLAAYLCTPFVTFEVSSLHDGQHVKGRTIAEFGSGNYPLDMVVYKKNGQERVLIANSNLPFMIVDPKAVEAYEGEITEKPESYTAGLAYEPRSGTGVQQLDTLNGEYLLALQRLPGGTLNLVSFPTRRF